MRIVHLALEHEEALRDFLADFAGAGETEIPAYFAEPAWSHAEIVANFASWAAGTQLPAGWVPCTTAFLVDDGELLGVSNLRHSLTDFLRQYGGHVGYSVRPSARGRGHATRLLEGTKQHARRLGIERLLLTCAPDNAPSIRVIEKCGGVFADEIFHETMQASVCRYWIELPR